MSVLEHILQEIEEYEDTYQGIGTLTLCPKWVKEIVKKHLSDNDKNIPTNDSWIPVDPNNIPDREVLCCDEYGEQLIGYLSNTEDGWICESEECTMYYVVGWMEKPESYRKDGE